MSIERLTVLSVQQPFADDLIFGDKDIEYRSWRTEYRGRLWIHASRWCPEIEFDEDELPPGFCETGVILGSVDLVTIFDDTDLSLVMQARQNESYSLTNLRQTLANFRFCQQCEEEDPVDPENPVSYAADIAETLQMIQHEEQRDAKRSREIPPRLQVLADWMDANAGHAVFPSGGGYYWLVQRPRALTEPIKMPGKLKLWYAEIAAARLQQVIPDTLFESQDV